ncbi:hypothetical protein HAX54_051190 [Datura stramonium]|uniref:J domain-containing protein n=1 Tax=Datura stramonium TaxID=4076 RepID=A0ABS8WRY0_DATST|nr:hypothetical protein [Datura stramonium]
MECNKDDALRAKEIAERKFLAKDFLGAKKFALKAQNLNPGLEGISQMLATLGVHIAAESKVNGEGNFYGILGVSPKADDEAIRKQYRKLALMLHPDKNKSIGAEAAFKHVSEAWSLLSDKNKKTVYDTKNVNALQQRVRAENVDSSQQSTQNGFQKFAKNAASRARPPKSSTNKKSSSSGMKERGTFWTVCYRCKMQYEYMRMYLNHNLLCPNCHEAFFAVETTPPSNGSKKSTEWDYSQPQENMYHQGMKMGAPTTGRNSSSSPNFGSSVFNNTDSADRNDFHWSPFSKTAGHASAVQAANMVQQAYQKVKRERQEAQTATKREEALKRKNHSSKRPSAAISAGQFNDFKRKKGINDPSTSRLRHSWESAGGSTSSPAEVERGNSERVRLNVTMELHNEKEVSCNDVKHLLMEKAKKEILKKLSERGSATLTTSMSSREVSLTKEAKESKNDENHVSEFDVKEDHDAAREQVTTETKVVANRSSSETFDNYVDNEPSGCMSIDVPDSDFHNFDSDRLENCFGPNQVWAAYDDSDGLPRYYAVILKVVSVNPFKARICWLNSNNSGAGSLNCVNSGAPQTCGYFRRGRHEIRTSVNCFSHKVRWTKGPGDTIQIFPKKGDIWALYSNWSSEWNEFTEDDVIHKYDLIEVLEDFNEEGVVVTPLIKVAGFKSVFHKHLNPREIRKIPREEMFRFSHGISSCLLTGKEGPNALKGFRELDPAAMPGEHLKVIQDIEEIECMDPEGSRDEHTIAGTGARSSNLMEETYSSMEDKEVIILDS